MPSGQVLPVATMGQQNGKMSRLPGLRRDGFPSGGAGAAVFIFPGAETPHAGVQKGIQGCFHEGVGVTGGG